MARGCCEERQILATMTPPGTQPPTQGNKGGVPTARGSAFPPNATFSVNPAITSSSQQTCDPVTMMQLQQLQFAQQQAARQHSAATHNLQVNAAVPAPVPNQFFVSTTMSAQGAVPTMQQASQLAAMQQAAATANANVPFLISDPNVFMQVVQQNALLQQQQQARHQQAMSLATMSALANAAPMATTQIQQPSVIQQFPILSPQTNAPGMNVQLKPFQMQMNMPARNPSVEQIPPSKPQVSMVPIESGSVQAKIDSTPVQQTLKVSQYETAGQALLSTTNDAKKIEHQPPQQGQQPQVALKAVESSEAGPDQVFLESSLEPVQRDEDSPQSAEEDMWKYFFKSDEELSNSNHNSEDFITSSIFSSDQDSPSIPMDTFPALQLTETASSNVASPAETCSHAVPLPALSAQKPAATKSGNSPKLVPARAGCGKVKKPFQPRQRPPITFEFQGSPQDYLKAILKERGYPSDRIPNDQTGFHSKPSELELASFGTEVVRAVHSGDVAKLKSLMDCGLSPSPCNAFGDYVVHLVCRRANYGILKCLVDHGCNLDVCDSFGRTPLHCAAWAGEFCKDSVELIMDANPSFVLVEDNRGQCPLEYIRKEHWPQWIEFLRNKMDTYWPIDGKPEQHLSSNAVKREPMPPISLELARAVASGALAPHVVSAMDETTRRYYKQESLKSILFS